ADEEPRAQLRVEQHRVLAPPPEPRPRRAVALQHRAGIDVAPAPRATRLGQVRGQALEAWADHVVVVAAPRVARDRPPALLRGLALVVVERHADRGPHARQDARGIEPLLDPALQV